MRAAASVIAWSLFWAAVVVGGFLLVEEARVWDLILRVLGGGDGRAGDAEA